MNKAIAIRRFFPFFTHHPSLVYLDSAATSLKPESVIEAVREYYEKYSLNSHSGGGGFLSQKIQHNIFQTRQLIAQKIKADPDEIFFLPSTTYALNILALSARDYLTPGDKICLTRLEHSSNCFPWEALVQEKDSQVIFLPLNKKFTIDIDKLVSYIDKKTKIVSFFHMSNSLGVINPVKEIAAKIKEINPNCWVIIDACQIGTLPLAQIFGLKASFEFLNSLDIKEINNYERELKNYALGKLKELEKVIIYNQELETVDIILFNLIGHHAHDVKNYLGKNSILVRADNFCCPYLPELIGEEAAVRISLFIYNTKEEIDKLVHCLKKLVENPDLIINVLDFSQ
ncbi:11324_t:CDS:2 [Racocetra fulgida]|uniref:11324_t:CDS:1 n=1 Tax=Racocetra fulgida TaxID=60492 RepID=A0A9N8VDP3_9GLOM|nr:11324_t:CDS:2 [Racocetra fulgida]